MDSFITNPGFEHLGQNILRLLNKKSTLAFRLVNYSAKDFVENPRFWLKKLNYKNSGSVELHEAWLTFIQKVEEGNPLLKKNIALVLMKLVDNSHHKKQFFPLHVVSGFADLLLVKFIMENSVVEILSKNCENRVTPILLAAEKGHTEIMKALIGSTDNPNAPDNNGWTPIHEAAQNGHTEIVNALMKHTDTPNAPNNFGVTPYQMAQNNNHLLVMNLLKRKRNLPDRECKKSKYS